jgi:hypothetical protein
MRIGALRPSCEPPQNQGVSDHRPRGRAESRDVVELKQLKQAHPELSSAIDMQLALLDLQRRIQSRVATPLLSYDEGRAQRLATGRRLVDFEEIPLDWSDLRLAFRQTLDILRRFGAIEERDHDVLQSLVREGSRIEPLTRDYYERTANRSGATAGDGVSPMLDTVLALSMRPFLARCCDVWLGRIDLSGWARAWCPICGGEPDFAALGGAGDRSLICGRCLAHWPFHRSACPFCGNDADGGVRSFASRDRRYRVYGCERCRKYLKAYDSRGASRPVMPSVDTIATLPLDAAAIQNGFDG